MSKVAETREELLEQLEEIHARLKQLDLQEGKRTPAPTLRKLPFKHPIDHSPLGVIEWDENLVVAHWSKRAEEIFGWTAEEVIGRPWNDFRFIHDDDIEHVKSVSQQLVSGEVDYNQSFNRNYCKDGSVVSCEWFNSVVREESGKVISWLSLASDVSDRLEVEQESKLVREAMSCIVEGTARCTGEDFYRALVKHLAEVFGFRYVFLGKLVGPDKSQASALAYWADGELAENVTYDLAGTPCDHVVAARTCFYPDSIVEQFPADTMLVDMKAVSYLGTPLVSSSGETLGLLSAIDDKPMNDRRAARQILELFANRAASEIERTIVQEALVETQHRQTLALEAGAIGTWDYDIPNDIVRADRGLALVFGIDYETAEAGAPLELYLARIHDDDRDDVVQRINESMFEGKPYNCQYRVFGQDRMRWVQARGRVELDENSQPVRAVGALADITERREIEHALYESEERFKTIFQNAPNAIFLINAEGKDRGAIIMANEAAEHMHGYRSGELTGKSLASLDVPEDAALLPDRLDRLANGDCLDFEVRHVRKDGTVFPVDVTAVRVAVDGIARVIAFARDVTERKRVEDSLRKMETELAHVDRISTMAEMVGGLAHELNQPLYAIQNFAKACSNIIGGEGINGGEGEIDKTQVQEWLGQIISASSFAGAVIMRLRDFVDSVPTKRGDVDIATVVDAAMTLTKHDATRAGIQVDCKIEGGLPQVKVDAIQIQQVLVNLLRNAFEAARQRGDDAPPRVAISASCQEGLLVLQVSDNGPGLPPDNFNLFDAFSSTKPSGMGLGLAISKTIIEGHGGLITASNSPDGGAVFSFRIRPDGEMIDSLEA